MSPYVPFVVLWAVLALAVISLIVYRRVVAAGEDDMIHISDAAGSVTSQQVTVAQKLDQIDKWGKMLTVVTVAYGVALAAIYVYQSWVSGV
jgi:negative regulator of sigma E activity